MEGNQKIHCTVGSCKYNNEENNVCILKAIQVEPTIDTKTKKPDESMCASYQYEKQ